MHVATFVLFVLAKGSVLNLNSLVVQGSEPVGRIIGGTPTTVLEVPYQASFRTRGRHFCGASILNARHALTAAHCCKTNRLVGLQVTSGSTYRNEGLAHPVREVFIHPKYNSFLTDFDACVLRVASPFVWSPTTRPIRLVPLGVKPVGSEPAVVSGWGTIKENGPVSQQLLKAIINVVPHKICKDIYGLQLTSRMFCAGGKVGKRDSCQGDSGGPLRSLLTNHQIGIVSWGFGCGDPRYPGVYTDIAHPEIHSFIISKSTS